MGEGISPQKLRKPKGENAPHGGKQGYSATKERRGRRRDQDPETQKNREKAKKILQNFDFNKLFYPSEKQRNAKSLQEGRKK